MFSRSQAGFAPDKQAQATLVYAAAAALSLIGFFAPSLPGGIALVLTPACLSFIANAAGPQLGILIPASMAVALGPALLFPPRAALPGTGLIWMLQVLVLRPHSAWGQPQPGASGPQLLALIGATAVAAFLGMLLREQDHAVAVLESERDRLDGAYRKLTDINLDFQSYALFAREDAMEKERKRLAGELHDIIGYTLTNQIMLIQAAQYGKGGPEETGAILEKARLHADESLKEARRALASLRERESDRPQGAALFLRLVRTFQEVTGIALTTDFGRLPPSLPRASEKILYRVIQEGLTNAFRHGKATAIDLSFQSEDRQVILRIRDNGSPPPGAERGEPPRPGIGLAGLRDQVEALGGALASEKVADGFILTARIPLREADDER